LLNKCDNKVTILYYYDTCSSGAGWLSCYYFIRHMQERRGIEYKIPREWKEIVEERWNKILEM